MKQKKLFSLAAVMMLAAVGFVSCTMDDNPAIEPDEPEVILPEAPYEFDEGSLVVNGQCDGAEVESYWCHEWRPDGYVDGPALIVADPDDPSNRCAAVVIRSEEEARAAGNAVTTNGQPDGAFADWDSQFFITFPEELALSAKDKVRLTMRVKADAAQSAGTQSHKAPGAYIHWYCVGDVNFTTEWTDFDSGFVTVGSGGSWGQAQEGMYTIAFNLAKGIHNTVYFDDIRIEVQRYDPFEDGNFVTNGRFEKDDMSSFACHEWRPDGYVDGPAQIVVDPADPTNHCAAVVIRSEDEARAAGNAVTTNGQPDGAFADWDSQFFISIPEDQALKDGDKIQLKMRIKADAPQAAATQSHKAPGAYIHWYGVGDVNFTTEWTDYDSGEVTVGSSGSWGQAQADMYTIAFNLAKGAHNTVYFDDVQVFIKRAQ